MKRKREIRLWEGREVGKREWMDFTQNAKGGERKGCLRVCVCACTPPEEESSSNNTVNARYTPTPHTKGMVGGPSLSISLTARVV